MYKTFSQDRAKLQEKFNARNYRCKCILRDSGRGTGEKERVKEEREREREKKKENPLGNCVGREFFREEAGS
ncbi:unnamed protein product [Allacma fusca]|uniref:Uncharacterized protein n=1 Tax=Allacma fusca TaxID=39272 RepID=A0A8J2KFX0_9HEXA|nr:unnamed protein product [Allacma fusca]